MTDKPYYNPKTKETYIKGAYKGLTVRFITGTVVQGCHITKRPTRWYNEFGEIVKEEPCLEYVKII